MRVLKTAVLLLVLMLVVTACGNGNDAAVVPEPVADTEEPTAEVTKVAFAGPGGVWGGWGYGYTAREEGFFAERNLDVTIHPGFDLSTSLQLLGAGTIQFGITRGVQLIQARNEGVPVKAIAVLIPHLVSGVSARHDAGISSPADFAGRKVGIPPDPEAQALFATMMSNVGLSKSDVEVVDPGLGGVTALLADGAIDAGHVLVFAEPLAYEKTVGEKPVTFAYRDFGAPPVYYYVLVANEDFAAKNPEVVKNFIDGLMEGMRHMRANPEEAADLFFDLRPAFDRDLHFAWTVALEDYWDDPTTLRDGPGAMTADTWQRALDWLWDEGLIDKRNDPGDYFTNEYLPTR